MLERDWSFRFCASGFRCEMNGAVSPQLMRQLMVSSCLISIVLSVSVGPRRPPAALERLRLSAQ